MPKITPPKNGTASTNKGKNNGSTRPSGKPPIVKQG